MTPHVKTIKAKPVKGKPRYMNVIIGGNGKVLMTSETLNSKGSARKNISAAWEALDNWNKGSEKI